MLHEKKACTGDRQELKFSRLELLSLLFELLGMNITVQQSLLNEIVRYITLHGLFISLAMSFGQLFAERKNAKNLIFFLLFLAFFFMESFTLLLISGHIADYPVFWVLGAASLYIMGPSFYFLALYTVSGKLRPVSIILLHYIPAVLGIAVLFIDTALWKTGFGLPGMPIRGAALAVYSLAYLQISVYMVRIPLLALTLHHSSLRIFFSRPEGVISLVLYLAFCSGLVMDILYYFTSSEFVLFSASAIVPLATSFLFLLLFRHPDTYTAAVGAGIYQKQKRSYLDGIDAATLAQRSEDIIEAEHLYASDRLSLPELADRLDLTVHQLSELLNRHIRKNYSEYINEFRIRKACRILEEEPAKSVLEICFEVGFSSKSSFNNSFRKKTGLTPSEYRKKRSPKL